MVISDYKPSVYIDYYQAASDIERLLSIRKRMEKKQCSIIQENVQLAVKAKEMIATRKKSKNEKSVSWYKKY